jgi:hypothetical protein
MWSTDDVARATVRRQGEGLSMAQVADKVAEAERREQETRQQLHSPAVDRGPYDSAPEDLAEQWVARHAEWRRVAALMDAQGWLALFTRTAADVHESGSRMRDPSNRTARRLRRTDSAVRAWSSGPPDHDWERRGVLPSPLALRALELSLAGPSPGGQPGRRR